MKSNNLKQANTKELHKELFLLLREYFNLRIKFSSGQLKQTHLLKYTRRNIARIKTFLIQRLK
uniref:Large ribosomal subunit protein uL29 n=1 Tax=Candidatus Aschnera chinzeii TaxID=1485666 RepID=A0AAT9G481_9ENTR|nr:MAG: 50S ribosomal protein L29 [Candidatus Aschnera chinzeii]